MNVYLTSGTPKISFGDTIFDEAGIGVITHDFDAKTLRLGTGYSILDENGDPIGGGAGVSEPANQIVYGTGSGVDSDSKLKFDPDLTATAFSYLSLDGNFTASDESPAAFLLNQTINAVVAMDSAPSAYGLLVFQTSSTVGIEDMYASYSAVNVDTAINGEAVALKLETFQTGAVPTLIGLEIADVTGATNNYAIKTGAGWITFGGLPTASAGLPTGTLWNDGGTIKVAA